MNEITNKLDNIITRLDKIITLLGGKNNDSYPTLLNESKISTYSHGVDPHYYDPNFTNNDIGLPSGTVKQSAAFPTDIINNKNI